MPLEQDIQSWEQTASRLRRDTGRDPLTGVSNRSSFEEALVTEFRRARRCCTVVGLLLVDLDGLKQVNERWGFTRGDQLLQEVATALSWNLRDTDVVARHRGDEFCILIADTTADALLALAERLHQTIATLQEPPVELLPLLTVSIVTVACFPRRGAHTCRQFLSAAEKAMDTVKSNHVKPITQVSLIAAADARFLQEVRARAFSTFLVQRGRIAEQDVHQVQRPAARIHTIGRLAQQLGWMSRETLQQVLVEQRRSRCLFGEIAVSRGFLTQEQVYGLLAVQREPPEVLRDTVIARNLLRTEQAQAEMQAYCRTVLGVDHWC